jgi:TPR repeat protein
VRVLDYGIACSPPKETIESLKKQKAFVLEQRRDAKERRIRLEMQDAEKGRASAQYMLGRRYLYGDGIAEDEDLARHWLESAAAQGNPDAQATLLVLGFQK